MSAPDSALSRETVAPFVPTILALESEEKRRKKQGRKVSYARSEKKDEENSQGRLGKTSDDTDERVLLGRLDRVLDGLDGLVESLLVPRLQHPLDDLVSLSSVPREDLEEVVEIGSLVVLVDVDSTVGGSVGGGLGRSRSLGLGRSGRRLDDNPGVSKVSEEEASVADDVVDEFLRNLDGSGELIGLSLSRSSSGLSFGLFLRGESKIRRGLVIGQEE